MPLIGVGGGSTPPESVVVGSGSYTVPAGKYGYLSMSTTSTVYPIAVGGYFAMGASSSGGNTAGSSSSNSNHQLVPAGTVITTSITGGNSTGFTTNSSVVSRSALITSAVRINGTEACYSSAGGHDRGLATGSATYGVQVFHGTRWSLSIYSE